MKDSEENRLKVRMLSDIRSGGAWFTTRKDNFIKIGYSQDDDCMFARECVIRNGKLAGAAYTFGTDWFDIYFHGKYIDIYADPETFRRWDISYDTENGTVCNEPEHESALAKRLIAFCRRADYEVLGGISDAYSISKAAFADILELSVD